MPSSLTLRKSERLYLRNAIDALFSSGEKMFVFPFKVLWKVSEASDDPLSWLISVPKRNIKKACRRNLIKRRTREIYRTHKSLLYQSLEGHSRSLQVAFIYCGKDVMTFRELEPKIQIILDELVKLVEKGA